MQKLIKNPLLLILILSLGLRLISLNQSLWLDEAIGAIAVHDYSYLGIITNFIKGDTHPPLYYLTLKAWTDIFGYSEIAMRMLSVVFSVATVWMVYLIALKIQKQELRIKNYVGKLSPFPILAMLLFATAPLHIYYSQEVRMYAMNTFLVSLVVLFYLKNDWLKYSITLLILGMTDYLPVLILPVIWLYSFFQKKSKKWWKIFVICHLPLAIFILLWFPTFLIQSEGSRVALQLFPGWGQLIGKAGIKELSLVWIKFLIGRITFENKLFYGLIVSLFSILVAIPLSKSIKQVNTLQLLWFWLIIPVALTFIGAIFVPGFSYFRMIIVLPAFYLLVAYGVIKTGECEGGGFRIAVRNDVVVIALVICNISFCLLYLLNSNYHREDWRGAVAYISSTKDDGDIVIQPFPEPFAGYRWYSKQCEDSIPAYGAMGTLGATDAEIESNTRYVTRDTNGVYYFEYLHDQTDPQGIIVQSLINQGFEKQTAKDFRGVGIVEYWKRGGS